MSAGEYLFSFSGRINRAKMWLFLLIAIGVEIVGLIVFGLLVGLSGATLMNLSNNPAALMSGGATAVAACLFLLLVFLVMFYMGLAVAAKRLHDRDKSAAWLLLFYLVPIILNIAGSSMRVAAQMQNPAQMSVPGAILGLIAAAITIWAFVELYCLRGTVGDNPYGRDPLARV
jgi:uncharacterized membrane protein YhaH (DUF805 family)